MKKLFIAWPLLIAATGSLFAQQYGITTIGGNGTVGWSGDRGPALSAQFRNPIRVAVDSRGNVYFTDYGNSSIREIFTDGTVNSVTGNGFPGFSGDGGSAVGAQLSSPHDIAFDSAGNLYIADTANSRIRRIDTRGNINTFAGNGTRGNGGDGGQATSAQLFLPVGVAVDSKGNVYIADAGNASVRRVATNGIITTMAGTGFLSYGAYSGEGGPANRALLGTPYSLAADGAGNIYIGDIGLSRLFRVGTDGNIRTMTTGFLAQNFASDAAGNLYTADYRNNLVEKILPGGTVLWIGGDGSPGYSGDFGVGTGAQMSQPYGVAVDAAGNVYVAEAGNAIIRKLTPRPFSIGAVANAATIRPFATPNGAFGDATVPIAPGEIVALFGTGLGPAGIVVNSPQPNGFYSKQLAGTTVTFAGVAAPIIYTSSTIVSAIVPYAINGLSTADIVVTYQGNKSLVYTAPVAATAPGIFTADASGSGPAKAVNLDGTLNDANHPVAVGGFVLLYATGEGATSPGGVDGKPASAPYPQPVNTVSATVGSLPAVVSYAGGAPGFVAGVMQVNVQIPAGVRAGSANVQLTINGVASPIASITVSQ